MRYFNAPDGCRISGTSMNLNDKGELAGGKAGENYYNKNWRYNSPAIRITATRMPDGMPENVKDNILMAVEGLAFIILLFLYLKARRNRAADSR